jgi:hypothetical protein
VRKLLLVVALAGVNATASAQEEHHHHEGMKMDAPLEISAQAIALATSTNISPGGKWLTEGYVTQPWLMAMYKVPGNIFQFNGMLNFEGLTIKRGELSPGIWGEGYIDRRHPHTYLHEFLVAAQTPRAVSGVTASLSFGKGFASFGTDDPMVRPFAKYPANHHLAQVLERLVLVGAVRRGPFTAEYTRFNGDEPQSPGDAPNFDRFGDSWALRATIQPTSSIEFQSSFARLVSPENAGGGGQDQRKISMSARYARETGYALAEFAQTREESAGKQSFQFRTFLAEGSRVVSAFTFAARVEVTERPEEERIGDSFRTPVPATDFHLNGITRWPLVTVGVTAPKRSLGHAGMAPFIELSAGRPVATIANTVFDPRTYYDASTVWSLSAGIRFSAGHSHSRMGRYGVAANE